MARRQDSRCCNMELILYFSSLRRRPAAGLGATPSHHPAPAPAVGPCAPTRIRSSLQSGEITRKWRALKAGKAEKQKTMICIHILACIARAQGSDADTFKPHALTNSRSKTPRVLQYDVRDQDTASFEFPISYGRLGPRAPTSRHSETTRVQLKK